MKIDKTLQHALQSVGFHAQGKAKSHSKALDKAKGFETKGDWVKRQKSFQKKNGHYDSRTTMEAHENK